MGAGGSARALVEAVGHPVLVGVQGAAALIDDGAGRCAGAGVLAVGHAVAVGVLAHGTEMQHREAGGAEIVGHRLEAEVRLGARGDDRPALDAQGDAIGEKQTDAGAGVHGIVGEMVRRARSEVEQCIAAERIDGEPGGVQRVDHERRTGDQGLQRVGGPARRGHRVLGLEQHVRFDADEVVQQIAQPETAARLLPEAERRIVARIGGERAGFELPGALPCEGARAERERARQQRDPSHGSWCSSTRRFCVRPAAVVLGAIGFAGP